MKTAEDRRTYAREWARRKREEKLSVARRGRATCPKRHGSGQCGGLLEDVVMRGGRVVTICPLCERALRGLCRDCGRPVEGQVRKALRCRDCKRTALARHGARFEVQNRETRRAQERARYRALSPGRRAVHLERKAGWRRRNPLKVALQERKARLAGAQGYRSREKYLAFQAKYNAARAAEKREYMKQRQTWYGRTPTCRRCGEPVAFKGVGRPRLDCEICRAKGTP